MGELTLIKYIREKFPQRQREIIKGIGDDAMVLKNGIVISTDSFVEGVHFDFKYFSRFNLGYRIMAASLSDLAAMGAKPICVLVSLYLPETTKNREIYELYRGFSVLARRYNFDISGGDIIESPYWGVTLTVVGKTKSPLLRCGANAGEFLYTTGYLGLSEVGRIVLKEGRSKKEYKDAIKKHLFPEPRIKEGLKIKGFASACIDTSDGLSTDAWHLSEESKVRIIIDDIPIHKEVEKFCSKKNLDPIEFILGAGEDFELLFTAPELPPLADFRIFKIGRVLKGKGIYILSNKRPVPLKLSGYEHLCPKR